MPAVHSLVEALGGSGIDHLAILRILHENARPARVEGMPSILWNRIATGFALVNSAARAQINDARLHGIDDDRKHIGVFDQALLDVVPVLAAVGRFPGQVPGAGIDDIGVNGVHRQRLDFVNLAAAMRADQRPGCAGIGAAIDTFEGSRKQQTGIRGGLGQRKNRLATQGFHDLPLPACVMADPQPAIALLGSPSARIEDGGICRIDDDVVEDHFFCRLEPRKTMPGRALIDRFVDPTVGGAQIKMTGLPRNRGKGARIAAGGTNGTPKRLRSQPVPAKRNQKRWHNKRETYAPA